MAKSSFKKSYPFSLRLVNKVSTVYYKRYSKLILTAKNKKNMKISNEKF